MLTLWILTGKSSPSPPWPKSIRHLLLPPALAHLSTLCAVSPVRTGLRITCLLLSTPGMFFFSCWIPVQNTGLSKPFFNWLFFFFFCTLFKCEYRMRIMNCMARALHGRSVASLASAPFLSLSLLLLCLSPCFCLSDA